jgi:hypothetical protein
MYPGKTLNNKDGQPPQPMEGGESFIQRMKRLNGQQNAEAAGVPQGTGQQTSPYSGPNQSRNPANKETQQGGIPGVNGQVGTPQPNIQAAISGQNGGTQHANDSQTHFFGGGGGLVPQSPNLGTPVSGDGKIPPPTAPSASNPMASAGDSKVGGTPGGIPPPPVTPVAADARDKAPGMPQPYALVVQGSDKGGGAPAPPSPMLSYGGSPAGGLYAGTAPTAPGAPGVATGPGGGGPLATGPMGGPFAGGPSTGGPVFGSSTSADIFGGGGGGVSLGDPKAGAAGGVYASSGGDAAAGSGGAAPGAPPPHPLASAPPPHPLVTPHPPAAPAAPAGPSAPAPPPTGPTTPASPTNPAGYPTMPDDVKLGPYDLGNDKFSTYDGMKFTGNTPDAYTAGTMPDAYSADKFSQFQGPDQSRLEGGQADLAAAILGRPESLTPEVIAGMKNSQKEDALLQAKQQSMRNAASAAARGVAGGGAAEVNDRRMYDAADSQILKSGRDIDLGAANQNFNNRLQSLGAVGDVLNSQMSRASQGYQNTLAGQSAQSGANQVAANSRLDVARANEANRQAAADSGLRTSQFDLARQAQQADENFRAFGTRSAAEDKTLQRKLSQFDINKAISGQNLDAYKTNSGNYFSGLDALRGDKSLALQGELGRGGLDMDRARLASSDAQFSKNYGLNLLQFLEGQRQANNQTGLGYAQLGAQGQSGLIQQIMGMLG